MTRISRSPDCGNSPKNKFAQELAIAVEMGDTKFLGEVLVEDATGTALAGHQLTRGDYLDSLASAPKPTAITIDRVVTHGKAGAVDGVSRMGRTGERRFSHVIHFANAKGDRVAHLSSYGSSG